MAKFNEPQFSIVEKHHHLDEYKWPVNEFLDFVIAYTKGHSNEYISIHLSCLVMDQHLYFFHNDQEALERIWETVQKHKSYAGPIYSFVENLIAGRVISSNPSIDRSVAGLSQPQVSILSNKINAPAVKFSAKNNSEGISNKNDSFVEILTPQGRYVADRFGLNLNLYDEVKSEDGTYLVPKGELWKFFDSNGRLIRNESNKFVVESYVKSKNEAIKAKAISILPNTLASVVSKESANPQGDSEGIAEEEIFTTPDAVKSVNKSEITDSKIIVSALAGSKIKLLSVKINHIEEHIPENDSAAIKSLIVEALSCPLTDILAPPDRCLIVVVYFYAVEKKIEVIFGDGVMHVWNGFGWENFNIKTNYFSYKNFNFQKAGSVGFNFKNRSLN